MSQTDLSQIDVVTEPNTSKEQKTAREKEKLLKALAAGDFKNLLPRVAYILNCYPNTRNSDITLALEFWQFFQPELFNRSGILPENLFKLERQMNLTRARAKIQNDYRLFLANDEVRHHRRRNEESMEQSVVDTRPEINSIRVFSDETGKNGSPDTYLIVASVWVLNGRAVFQVTSAISDWKIKNGWGSKELHFNKLKRHHTEAIHELTEIISANREYLSFKSIAIQHKNLKRRSVENAVIQLHERMVNYGTFHEVNTGRVGLPRELHLTIDHETSIDGLALDTMKQEVHAYLSSKFPDGITIGQFATVDSESSLLVQLADLLAGSLNRVLNTAGNNHLDEFAQQFLTALGIHLQEHKSSDDFDSYAMFHL